MTSNTADMDRDDEWDDASDEWSEGWADIWDEEPLDPDDPRSFIVPLLLDLLGGGGSAGDLPPVEVAAAQGVAAPYFQRLMRLVELLGDGAEVENMFMPLQEDADRIAEDLGLSNEKSRADLMKLWLDALGAQMITVADGRARPAITTATLADIPVLEQLRAARRVGVSKVWEAIEAGPAYASVLYLLVGSFVADRAWLSIDGSVQFGASRGVYGYPYDDYDTREADLDEALDSLVGMAVVERDGDLVRLTEFGDRVLNEWIEHILEF